MLDHEDEERLRHALALAENATAASFLRTEFEDFPASEHMTFDHTAVLVFPSHVDDVVAFLDDVGYVVREPFASVVVRGRLAHRYGVPEEHLDVSIVRAFLPNRTNGGVEVFVLPKASASVHKGMIARERATGAEGHLAWTVDGEFADEVWNGCLRLGMTADGGGHNPNENAAEGGCTVLYLKPAADTPRAERISRMELKMAGFHPEILEAHNSNAAKVPDAHTALLSVLAGHWAARALHVAVQIGLADVLDGEPLRAKDIAARLKCDPAATARLLRFLERSGVVRQLDDATYVNTEMGDLLCSGNPFCDLTRLYGGDFYDAWSEFESTLRTGATAFRHRFATEHFDHFSQHPERARTFDRAMQAVSAIVAGELAKAQCFPDGATVVDVGGGNGTLLRAVLAEHPAVSGVLFDRDHVAGNALAVHGEEERFRAVAGDFFEAVPSGGDVYLLSRVLHDWSDEDCERILVNCRAACRDGAALLVLERFLPEASSPPRQGELGSLWDLQMLAITGGRERERSEYEKLLLNAGFRIDSVRPLGVDMNVVAATAC